MDITSLLFLFLFLPVFATIYLIAKEELRLWIIIIGSLVFLTWGDRHSIIWISIVLFTSYAVGYCISIAKGKGKLIWLLVGLSINLALLFLFKTYASYGPQLNSLIDISSPLKQPFSRLTIPLGISYVTFQAISYLVDVWRGTISAEKNIPRFAAYLLFFPKLISGPLMRYGSFAGQMNKLDPSPENVAKGIRRLFIGFIKRTLIANQVALIADAVFNLSEPNIAPHLAWLGLIAYTLQIYFDFAGYTDMAIGLGMMVGIQLPENFNLPYMAQSISDFWRRWHMTLTAWFREYVFYPLERRRLKWAGQQINILLVFLLTGLWHGFKPTYIVWGLIYGIALAIESLGFGRWLSRIWRPIRHAYALTIILSGWVFFRSNSLNFAFGFFRRLAGDFTGVTTLPFSVTTPLPFIEPTIIVAMIGGIILSFPLPSFISQEKDHLEKNKPGIYFALQIAQDLVLAALYILGLAAILSEGYMPNIYAAF